MNVENTLKQLKIDPNESVYVAVRKVQEIIDGSNDRLMSANRIISMLGAPVVSKERTAAVLAKGLVEQALVRGEEYNPTEAITVVAGKYMKLVSDMPGVYETKGNPWKEPTTTQPSQPGTDKKVRAMQIFEQHKHLGNSEIARIIAKELNISFANAYYYCSRVFVR